MLAELEPRKFRRGENADKPYGGNIAGLPFPRALYEIAVYNGFESQSDLARHLGNRNHGVVARWYNGERVPSDESFGELLILLKPNDDKSEKMTERLVDSWAQLFTEGKGLRGSRPGKYTRLRKTSETPFAIWLESFCRDREITMSGFLKKSKAGVRPGTRNKFGGTTFENMLKNAPSAFGMLEEEKNALDVAIAQTIKQKKESDHRFRSYKKEKKTK